MGHHLSGFFLSKYTHHGLEKNLQFCRKYFYVKVCQDFFKNPEFVQEHSDLRNKLYSTKTIFLCSTYLSQNFKFRACLFSKSSSWILCELQYTKVAKLFQLIIFNYIQVRQIFYCVLFDSIKLIIQLAKHVGRAGFENQQSELTV